MYATGMPSKEAGAMILLLQKSKNNIMTWFAPMTALEKTWKKSHHTASLKISNVPVYFSNHWEVDHSARWVEIHGGGYIPQVMRRSGHLHSKQHYEQNPKLRVPVVKGIHYHSMWAYFREEAAGNAPRRTWMNSVNPKRTILAAVSKKIHFRHVLSGISLYSYEKTMTLPTLDEAIPLEMRTTTRTKIRRDPTHNSEMIPRYRDIRYTHLLVIDGLLHAPRVCGKGNWSRFMIVYDSNAPPNVLDLVPKRNSPVPHECCQCYRFSCLLN